MTGHAARFGARRTHGLIGGFMLLALASAAHGAQLILLDQFTYNAISSSISYDGQIVVAPTSGSTPPTYWTSAQGFVQVPGRTGNFIGISGDGSTMVGGSVNDSFRYSFATGYSDMPNMAGATNTISLGANSLSDDGSIATGVEYTGSVNALVWDANGNPTRLAFNSSGRDISGDGTVVVGTGRDAGKDQAALWAWNGLTQTWELTFLTSGTGNTGVAYAVSRDGTTVFGQTPGNSAFRWTEAGGLLDLDAGFNSSAIYATTADGVFGGGMFVAGDGRTAAIWDETHGWRTLASLLLAAGLEENEIPDFRDVAALSADGRYLVATYGSGSISGAYWVDLGAPLSAVPLPAAAWLFLSGLLGLAGLARRKNRS